MRIFGSETMNNMLEKLGLKDGESIDHPWINKALERAQQKVEARNFDIRKTLIKFDNVLNDQRHVIFSQRKNAIKSKYLWIFWSFLNGILDDLIKTKGQKLSVEQNKDFSNRIKMIIGKNFDKTDLENLLKLNNNEIKTNIIKEFKKFVRKINLIGEKQVNELEKRIFLQSIDLNWKSHIVFRAIKASNWIKIV